MSHPLDTWGKVVTAPADESDLQRIRIEQAQTGFHIIVVQQSGVFDYWLEGEDEVLDYLRSMEVKWEGAPATGDNGGAPSDGQSLGRCRAAQHRT